jgi:preprotein translocase subunit SecG
LAGIHSNREVNKLEVRSNGAGASGSVFGARGANSFMYKLTASIAVGFFITSLTLAYLATPASTEKKSSAIKPNANNI